jgi:hypothetical protein
MVAPPSASRFSSRLECNRLRRPCVPLLHRKMKWRLESWCSTVRIPLSKLMRSTTGSTLLAAGDHDNDTRIFEYFLDRWDERYASTSGAGSGGKNFAGDYPIHVARCDPNVSLQAIQVLVNRRPDALATGDGEQGLLPLHFAAMWDARLDVIFFLLQQCPMPCVITSIIIMLEMRPLCSQWTTRTRATPAQHWKLTGMTTILEYKTITRRQIVVAQSRKGPKPIIRK